MLASSITGVGQEGVRLTESAVRAACAGEISRWNVRGKRVLALLPDSTRTAPMALMFRVLHEELTAQGASLDVMIALGTHPPMSDESIDRHLGLTKADRTGKYAHTKLMNHAWDDPRALVSIGVLSEDEVASLSEGRLRERVDVTLNERALQYDLLLIVGPTFPHEVIGFSGGNKYIFPGISGRAIIDAFHWLGALITSPNLMGIKDTPVRAIVDRAASLVPVERKCVSLVVDGTDLVGLYVGSPEQAWSAAADLSGQIHIRYVDRPYRSVLSCAPAMYDELWVGGKCVYKLEPVVADGGELIVYAPHISRVSTTHGKAIHEVGYHVRDYIVAHLARFAPIPRGVLAHSAHVKGAGAYESGVERPRIRVTLATGIPESECRALNLDYRDFRSIDVDQWRKGDRETLYVPKAGETLFRIGEPATAGGASAAPATTG
jgi:nickel-dependent lactate racemase